MIYRKLKLNENKTEFIEIKGTNKPNDSNLLYEFEFGNNVLKASNKIKNLGITMDPNLNYDLHIDSIVRKCNIGIRNLYLTKKYLDKKTLLVAVHAMISSNIDYCNSLYYGLPKKYIAKLQKLQNRALRLIHFIPIYLHITPYLIENHWLPIKERIEFKICLIIYKILKY